MLFKDLHTRISQADPAWKLTGYWVASFGTLLTLGMGFGSFVSPEIRASKLWSIPPCVILAGLALEGVETTLAVSAKQHAANRKEGK
jgi:hypothetical protein